MELIDREDHQKLYLQLYEILKKKIEANEWPVGSQIPTEEELCKMFNISRVTVRTAIMELVRHGYLKRQQGRGTFIFKNTGSEGLTMTTSFKEIMLDDEVNYSPNVLVRTVMMPIDDLHIKLDISPDKHVIYIKRLWSVGLEPIVIQETYIPYHICPLLLEDDLENNSLFELFEKKYSIKITKVKTDIDIICLNADEAVLLKLLEGSTATLLTQFFYSGETLLMYTRSINRPDRFKFFMKFERKVS